MQVGHGSGVHTPACEAIVSEAHLPSNPYLCQSGGTCAHAGKTVEGLDTAFIHFTPIPEPTVDQLLAEGDCLYCAGGLMVEHRLVVPHVTRIDGTQDSVMGLSKLLVMRLLLQAAGMLQEGEANGSQ